MLRIRAEQTRELQRQIALGQLQEDMIVHLRNFAPNDAEAIGDDGVRRAVRFGAERARVYGVTNAGLLRFHVELMFMFGGLFDTDPLLPWARGILVDPDISDEEARLRSLHDAMLVYLNAVAGPDRSFARPSTGSGGSALRTSPGRTMGGSKRRSTPCSCSIPSAAHTLARRGCADSFVTRPRRRTAALWRPIEASRSSR